MNSPEDQLQGLVWVQKTFNLEPRWTVEPKNEATQGIIQTLYPLRKIHVHFLAQGALNKLYEVKIGDEVFVMRISLPVDPHYKTISEVTTLDWISRTTNIPVPRVLTSQSNRENPIGFEWIFMTKMPGKLLRELWHSLSFTAKSSLVREFAIYSGRLFRNQLHGIGNIYKAESVSNDILSDKATETLPTANSTYPANNPSLSEFPKGQSQPGVGRIVSMHFFWGSHILQDVYRGPYHSSRDWILSRLSLTEKDCRSTLDNLPSGDLGSDDEAEADDATRTLGIIGKLKELLPIVFPQNGDVTEPSIMVHDDLSSRNILLHDTGELAAVLDWECVSALPVWNACYYPDFLKGRPRRKEPDVN
ncbi:hypothetical protein N7493_009704 [Penicillium malachiteum]|uniref:non-specific serine/threonine protein kinase n=1 Tax=Penicillium malachiteum TaxID=1324776 RepID=A0AAD6HEP5_9EURO|nr:hypothetical protein N7493_009704 [Penicillium malachiteum]